MRDLATFLTELYVIIDDWDKTQPPPPVQPGPPAKLSRSEVLTLAIVGQWSRFASERAFWRFAEHTLRAYFPQLPCRPQFNRAQRRLVTVVTQLALWLGQQWEGAPAFEILDAAGVATRDAKRRGAGWLAGTAALGQCTRLGWYAGVRLLLCCTPQGAITGFGLAPANTNDRWLAETFVALRACPDGRMPGIGTSPTDVYIADKGFAGIAWETRWERDYHAVVVCQPSKSDRKAGRIWTRAERRAHAGRRQIVESVFDRLLNTFRLSRERPHQLDGLQVRLAAKIALHNVCHWLNRQSGRPALAFASLLD
jgi:hypothetical protein